ncbi:MAG: ATP-binding cassette domain-containing protein, partial [Youngiibacter sp.]|nr:ATP-binding cassette domain-containing protein [Youngiibacter sp.]
EYTSIDAVKDVSFNIKRGEIIGYIGANGAGKSTTIKMMTGILTPTEGYVKVDGRIPYEERTENARHIGVVFGQKTQLWWDLPLGETYSILKEIYEVPDDFYEEQMKYFDQVFELSTFMDKTVRTLSLGQRMRADLAASMLHNPQVLFLDEPTIGLDVVVKERIRKAIKDMNEKYGTTIVLTTHDMSDIEELCHRIIIIDKGSILYDGAIDKIRKDYGFERKITFDLRYDDEKTVIESLSSIYSAIDGSMSENLRFIVQDNQAVINFNRNEISISSIMNFVLHNFNVLDFSVQDMDIEAIVKQIYTN